MENLPSTEVSDETLKILSEANKSLLVSIYQKDFNDHGDLRLKTMTDQEVVETFENLELKVSRIIVEEQSYFRHFCPKNRFFLFILFSSVKTFCRIKLKF